MAFSSAHLSGCSHWKSILLNVHHQTTLFDKNSNTTKLEVDTMKMLQKSLRLQQARKRSHLVTMPPFPRCYQNRTSSESNSATSSRIFEILLKIETQGGKICEIPSNMPALETTRSQLPWKSNNYITSWQQIALFSLLTTRTGVESRPKLLFTKMSDSRILDLLEPFNQENETNNFNSKLTLSLSL